jgi:hypothetical protein
VADQSLFPIPKPPPGAIRINCLGCDAKGLSSCFGVLWQHEVKEEEINRLRSEGIRVHRVPSPSWLLSIRFRHRAMRNTDAGPRPSISSKRESEFFTVARGVADATCMRCKRRVTLSAKALGRQADGNTSVLLV